MNSKQVTRPIVVVTGANGGVGFAVCHRLLVQLSRKTPPDSLPQPDVTRRIPVQTDPQVGLGIEEGDCDGITIIMACRSIKKAEDARADLLRLLDEDIDLQKTQPDYAGHADAFRRNVNIVIHQLDLGSIKSIFEFGKEVNAKYSYISAIIMNAGFAPMTGIDFVGMFKQFFHDGIDTFVHPVYKLQPKGMKSEDGLGWVWQCNVFGHYVMYRLLQPLLEQYWTSSSSSARVIWMSSVEALSSSYSRDDWQLLNAALPYEASKYEMDLLVGYFETRQHKYIVRSGVNYQPKIRHFVTHPGVVGTKIAHASLSHNKLLIGLMQVVFYILNFIGSPNHTLTAYNAAISTVHLLLVALPLITVALPKDSPQDIVPLKFGSQVTRWRKAYVGVTEVEDWESHREQSVELAKNFEELFLQLAKEQGTVVSQIS